jgi:hypothetical protein
MLLKLFHEIGREGVFPNSFYEASIKLITKTRQGHNKKENCINNFLYEDTKISMKYLQTEFTNTFKRLHTIIKFFLKLSWFADDISLSLKDPKDSTRRLLELTNTFSKAAGFKINIQKPVAFLYTNNKFTEKVVSRTISFTIALKKTPKHLGINVTKDVKELYNENYKALKETEEDTRR